MRGVAILLHLLLTGSFVWTQPLSERAEISLLTYTPSNDLYAAFGHSALRVHDPATDYDLVFNYGMFSFDEGNFYLKFAQGKLNYWLGAYDFRYLEREHLKRNATIREQVLNLGSVFKIRMRILPIFQDCS